MEEESIKPEDGKTLPPFFRELIGRGCLDDGQMRCTSDGFCAAVKSLADILIGQGITTFPNDGGSCGTAINSLTTGTAMPCPGSRITSMACSS